MTSNTKFICIYNLQKKNILVKFILNPTVIESVQAKAHVLIPVDISFPLIATFDYFEIKKLPPVQAVEITHSLDNK